MDVSLEKLTLGQLVARGDGRTGEDDRIAYGDPAKVAVFAANPRAKGLDPVTRVVLRADGNVAGGEYNYPVDIVADGKVVHCVSGSETRVKEEYRKQAVGLEFLSSEGDIRESSTISTGCGMAQRYARIHKLFGYKIFPMYRHIALFRSRSVVEMAVRGATGRCLAALINLPLNFYWQILFLVNRIPSCRVRTVAPEDSEALALVARMIGDAPGRFSERHDEAWLVWHLTCALHPEGPARLCLVERRGVPVAFFMLKRKFHEQASSRGFKNVMLGSVIEWGGVPGCPIAEKRLLLLAVRQLRKMKVDAAEVVVADRKLSSVLRRNMMMPVGESNFGIRVGAKSELAAIPGWEVAENWRLRPAMCDNGL